MKTKENCKNQSVNTKDEELEYRVSSPDYGELIIEGIDDILCSHNKTQKEIIYYICLGLLQKKR